MTDFDTFWQAYPRKIGKGAARKSFQRAIRKTTLATMLKAIEAYRANKPDWQDYCHPATWLNHERWDDEWPDLDFYGKERVNEKNFRRPTQEECRLYREEHPYYHQDPEWIPIDWKPKLRVVK